MLVKCILKKTTASRTYEKGKDYDVRSVDAQIGLNDDKPWFKKASEAESKAFYEEKQAKSIQAKSSSKKK